ncbi:hypothetical protein [Marinilabilia salmonicolor]|uniref:hypothetical protein n=1 Tax=Marinilabilia salmonicolor TaxID=989 RepID=UPI00046A36D0|nr:hypothetical protein [Marinilabilia salmonicolor]
MKIRKNILFTSFGQFIGSSADEKGSISSFRIAPALRLGDHWAVGLTTGVEWFDVPLLPVGPDIKYFFPSKDNGGFFLQGALGHSFPLEDASLEYAEVLETKGGFFTQYHLGYLIPLKGKNKLLFSVGYHYQVSGHVQEHWIYRELERKIKYNRFSVRIGVAIF